jgi:hypothetical protein
MYVYSFTRGGWCCVVHECKPRAPHVCLKTRWSHGGRRDDNLPAVAANAHADERAG